MLFNSPEFLFALLPATLIAYYLARRLISHDAALFVLNVASLVFYGWWDPRYLPLLVFSAVANFYLGRTILAQRDGGERAGRGVLAFGVVLNLALIGLFKYADFAVRNVNAVTGADLPLPELDLPLAISFFTFQQIAFLVDVYAKRTAPDTLARHLLFVAFFPQLIAGPIVAHRLMGPQLADAKRRDDIWANLGIGLSIFAVGLAKKVLLADNIEPFASAVFGGAARGETLGLIEAWVGALAYALQIFFDFSGYSDMALGLGRMFGYTLPINFNAPYKSASIVEFWRRWHITLSHFLRDYLYIPLGGNRKGPARRYANLAIVMLLGGLWHGAAWTFVVWGGLHGLALMVNHVFDRIRPGGLAPRARVFSVIVTFLFVVVAWVFFRAESFGSAAAVLSAMAGANGLGPLAADDALVALALGYLIVWAAPDTPTLFAGALDKGVKREAGVTASRPRWSATPAWAVAAAALLFFAVINTWKASEFIYYTF